MPLRSNISVERDRPQAALVGALRGFAATAAPHVKRWVPKFIDFYANFNPYVLKEEK